MKHAAFQVAEADAAELIPQLLEHLAAHHSIVGDPDLVGTTDGLSTYRVQVLDRAWRAMGYSSDEVRQMLGELDG